MMLLVELALTVSPLAIATAATVPAIGLVNATSVRFCSATVMLA